MNEEDPGTNEQHEDFDANVPSGSESPGAETAANETSLTTPVPPSEAGLTAGERLDQSLAKLQRGLASESKRLRIVVRCLDDIRETLANTRPISEQVAQGFPKLMNSLFAYFDDGQAFFAEKLEELSAIMELFQAVLDGASKSELEAGAAESGGEERT